MTKPLISKHLGKKVRTRKITDKYKDLLHDDGDITDYDSLPNLDYTVRKHSLPAIADRKLYKKVIKCISNNNHISVAAKVAGVTPQIIYRWLEYGKAGKNKLYYRFWCDVRRAEAKAEMVLVDYVTKQAKHDWRAGMTILERRWPKRWAKKEESKNKTQVTINSEVRIIKNEFAQAIINDPEAREHARKLISRTPRLLDAGGSGDTGK